MYGWGLVCIISIMILINLIFIIKFGFRDIYLITLKYGRLVHREAKKIHNKYVEIKERFFEKPEKIKYTVKVIKQ